MHVMTDPDLMSAWFTEFVVKAAVRTTYQQKELHMGKTQSQVTASQSYFVRNMNARRHVGIEVFCTGV